MWLALRAAYRLLLADKGVAWPFSLRPEFILFVFLRVSPLMEFALVGGGAVLGALARWRLASAGPQPSWPTTLAINVAGSLALGTLAGRFGDSKPRVMLLSGTGFLGSFTTFSTFSLDTVLLLERGLLQQALLVCVGTPAAGVASAAAGLLLGRRLLQRARR